MEAYSPGRRIKQMALRIIPSHGIHNLNISYRCKTITPKVNEISVYFYNSHFFNTYCYVMQKFAVQSLTHVQLFVTPWTTAPQTSLSFTISLSLLRLMSIESVLPSNHLILCHPPLLCPHSFPASGSFPMSRLFTSAGQNMGALASVLPMNIQGWFPSGLTGLISLLSKGLSIVFSSTTIVQKHQFFGAQPSLWSNSHIHTWLLEKL